MTDYGHDLTFGSFITPTNAAPEQVLALAQVSEQAGLDLVTFQDHPYQAGFLETWGLDLGVPLLMWCRNGFQPPRAPPTCHEVSRAPTSTPSRAAWV